MIHFESLPDCAIVRLPVVRQLFGISSPTVWRWSKNGLLPVPIRVAGITGWQVGAIKSALKRHAHVESTHD
jgi:predicted DNA-binding transcriptional regulator AlpA